MDLEFTGPIWFWRGPAPFHFVTVPDGPCDEISAVARSVTYGWGMIPATVRIGSTEWTTALWPKDGRYVVPLKARVREAEQLEIGDEIAIGLTIDAAASP